MRQTQPILAPEHLPMLTGYALSNVLLAFDYDGTLAPIAARPQEAHMRPSTRRLLAGVALAYPTVVISGRALADVTAMLDEVPLWQVYGNHGLEGPHMTSGAPADTRAWVSTLESRLAGLDVWLEDKHHTVTLHYRGATDRTATIAAIEAAIEHLPDVTVLQGNEAINLLPRNGGHKGTALEQARNTFACHHAIYVGDEDTDEAAFASGGARTLAIRVDPAPESAAAYHLGSQMNIDRLLQILLELRPCANGRHGTPS